MAKAVINKKTTVSVTDVTLTLSADEARALRDVVGSVAGTMTSRRKHTQAIYSALAGVDPEPRFTYDLTGLLQFIG